MTRVRICFFAAAALAALALAFPVWGFRMSAPQYPGESLHLRVSRAGIQGDVTEIATLQKYIGVKFPQRIPELAFLAPALIALAVLLALGGLAGDARGGRALRTAAGALFLLFLLASAVFVQKRLWELGHRRDPNAPLQSIRNFTPPAIGCVKVGNFTVCSYPHGGGAALALAAGLVVLGVAGEKRRRPACDCASADAAVRARA